MEFLQDILAAIGVVLNGIPQGLLALSMGFASVPTALGFGVGVIGCLLLGSVAPISFQAETIVLAGTMGKNMRERLSMVFFAGVTMAALGACGLLTAIVNFAGETVLNAMMAGVGLVLTKLALGMMKENKLVGITSVVTAVLVYFFLGQNLVYTIVISLVVSSAAAKLAGQDIGGGVPGGKKFKAAQTGGPSGGCIPASLIDTPIDYESLSAIGSMMGSGGLIVMDEDNCMVDIAKFYLEFIVDESCGKCSPCRIGTKRLLDLLTKITEGNGEPEDLDTIEELCHHIKQSALCGLGQTAPNPVLSTLTHFREEFEAHIYEKRCPAGVCKALIQYIVDPTKCKGCTRCAQGCPTGAISGAVRAPHIINQSKCIKCGACMDHCRFDAIYKQ